MAPPTIQKIEARKADKRVKSYLAGGSRPVLISRAVVAGVIVVIWILLWWRG